MLTAEDFLNAYRNAFIEKDASHLNSVMSDDFTMTLQGDGITMNRAEILEWAVSGSVFTIEDYTILHDTDDCIAGTHTAAGKEGTDEWYHKVFFFAKKSGDKVTEWHVLGAPVQD